MIYSVYMIDADTGILLLEHSFKKKASYEDNESQILASFFQSLNSTIDDIHKSLRKGRDLSHMNRILNTEGATLILHYMYEGRILFATISDADDNVEKILDALKDLGKRFWKKHYVDVENFRATTQKEIFKSFLFEIQMLLLNGKIAEEFPKLSVSEATLQRIQSMGMINKIELAMAKLCDGTNSPLQLSRKLNLHSQEIIVMLRHLADLDVLEKKEK